MKLLDNESRGLRTVFWLKFNVVVLLVFSVAMILLTGSIEDVEEIIDENFTPDALLIASLGVTVLSGLLLTVSSLIYIICWSKWIYRATENLRKVHASRWSPVGAVLCPYIPAFGMIFLYFIFRDMFRGAERSLESRTSAFQPLNRSLLNAWLVINILNFFGAMLLGGVVFEDILLGILILANAGMTVAILKRYIRQEKLLVDAVNDESLKEKVAQMMEEVRAKSETETVPATSETSGKGESKDSSTPDSPR